MGLDDHRKKLPQHSSVLLPLHAYMGASKGVDTLRDVWTDDEQLLIDYLNTYRICRGQLMALERRRRDIIADFEFSPFAAVVSDGMPHGNSIGDGAATFALRLDDIDTKIQNQCHRMRMRIESIMELIDQLPEDSEERAVLEQRYLNRETMEHISRNLHMARRTTYRIFRKAIEELLTFQKTFDVIHHYEDSESHNID